MLAFLNKKCYNETHPSVYFRDRHPDQLDPLQDAGIAGGNVRDTGLLAGPILL